MMEIALEMHLGIALIALLYLGKIDATYFEISPQWAIIAYAHMTAFQMTLGVSALDLLQGAAFLAALTAAYVCQLRGFGKRIGLGDLYLLPLFGLLFPRFEYIWAGLILLIALLMFHKFVLSKRRGKPFWKGHMPVAPAFCTALGIVLMVQYVQGASAQVTHAFQSPFLSQFQVLILSFAASAAALAWFIHEHINWRKTH